MAEELVNNSPGAAAKNEAATPTKTDTPTNTKERDRADEEVKYIKIRAKPLCGCKYLWSSDFVCNFLVAALFTAAFATGVMDIRAKPANEQKLFIVLVTASLVTAVCSVIDIILKLSKAVYGLPKLFRMNVFLVPLYGVGTFGILFLSIYCLFTEKGNKSMVTSSIISIVGAFVLNFELNFKIKVMCAVFNCY